MSGGEVAGPDAQAIRAILMARAAARSNSYGRSFKPVAELSLAEMLADAAQEIYSPGRFGARSEQWSAMDIAGRIAEGTRAVERLVDLMEAAAAGIAGYEPDRLGERSLSSAMGGFCPCWPFC